MEWIHYSLYEHSQIIIVSVNLEIFVVKNLMFSQSMAATKINLTKMRAHY